MSRHTLSVLVEDQPGVLARIAGLFSRRGFNIESLAVGPTETPEVSRITLVVEVEGLPLEQVTKQLNKLVNVLKIVELEPGTSVQREFMLVKVRADASTRSHVLETVALFRAGVVDVAPDAVTIEATGQPRQARRAAAGARAVRHPRAGQVRGGGPGPRLQVHDRARPAPDRPDRLTPTNGVGSRFRPLDRPNRLPTCALGPSCAAGPLSRPVTESPRRPCAAAHTRRSPAPYARRNTQGAPQWLSCSTTTTPTSRSSRAARSPCSDTAARATPTR